MVASLTMKGQLAQKDSFKRENNEEQSSFNAKEVIQRNLFLAIAPYWWSEYKTISDGGITVDFWIIKVYTSN